MRIIGSGRIDDYKKVSLEDTVLKAIDAKPGDSILFYERHNDDSVCIFKSEGAKISTEADGPRRRHMREAFIRLRLFLVIAAACMVAGMVMAVVSYSSLGLFGFLAVLIPAIIALLFTVACIQLSRMVDNPYESQALVNVGNVYSKNRITGVTKMSTDGIVASANLYVNSLFGAKVDDVVVKIRPEGQEEFDAVVNLVKSVPGYSVYKFHLKENIPSTGDMDVIGTYRYLGKSIVVHSRFKLEYDSKAKNINVTEGGIEATIEFENLNKTVFDENWMNDSEERF